MTNKIFKQTIKTYGSPLQPLVRNIWWLDC